MKLVQCICTDRCRQMYADRQTDGEVYSPLLTVSSEWLVPHSSRCFSTSFALSAAMHPTLSKGQLAGRRGQDVSMCVLSMRRLMSGSPHSLGQRITFWGHSASWLSASQREYLTWQSWLGQFSGQNLHSSPQPILLQWYAKAWSCFLMTSPAMSRLSLEDR